MAKPTQPIIIKKVKKAAHVHHGGAWKIAYADFVTAMMAFFLLMWLINMTTQEQKNGLAEYFAPGSTTGAGGLMAGTALDQSGNKSSASRNPAKSATGQEDGARLTSSGRAGDREVSRPSVALQAAAMARIRQALQQMPEIAELSNNIMIEQTEEGLNVSLVDQDGRSMFAEGSTQPYDHTRRVLEAIAPTLRLLPNQLSVTGHSSAANAGTVRTVDPWGLTAGRAVAVREILSGAGVPTEQFASVSGRADTEPVFPDNPYLAPNRRVTITLLNAEPALPPSVIR
jgi:chemotaxis protein MotB